jgi:hypothetical protein
MRRDRPASDHWVVTVAVVAVTVRDVSLAV